MKRISPRTNAPTVLFVAYLVVLFSMTMYPTCSPAAYRTKLTPFESMAELLEKGGWELVWNVPGNVAAFLPLGLLLPLLVDLRFSVFRIAAVSALLSLLIEVLQFVSRRRIADVDDILLNTMGGVLGFLAYHGMNRMISELKSSHVTT